MRSGSVCPSVGRGTVDEEPLVSVLHIVAERRIYRELCGMEGCGNRQAEAGATIATEIEGIVSVIRELAQRNRIAFCSGECFIRRYRFVSRCVSVFIGYALFYRP